MHRVNRCLAVLGRSTGAYSLRHARESCRSAARARLTAVLDALSSCIPLASRPSRQTENAWSTATWSRASVAGPR